MDRDEIRSLLPAEEAGIFSYACGVLPGGNFKNEVTGRILGIMSSTGRRRWNCVRFGMDTAGVEALLAGCRRLLKAAASPPTDGR